MPIYEYECKKCGTFEAVQSMSEEPLKRCPECRSKVSRLISSSSFHLRGGGWYADSYDAKSPKPKEKSSSAETSKGAESTKKSSDKATATAGKASSKTSGKKK
jgi:putative FmdB family regulatory protein